MKPSKIDKNTDIDDVLTAMTPKVTGFARSMVNKWQLPEQYVEDLVSVGLDAVDDNFRRYDPEDTNQNFEK